MKTNNISKISIEKRNKNTLNIDTSKTIEMINMINKEDKKIALAIAKVNKQIAKVIDICFKSLKNNGRVFYIGAGTSGRLGILDASEIVPTFNMKNKFIGIIAGGDKALRHSIEGAEDSKSQAAKDLIKYKITKNDVLIGIAASGRTPYVKSGLLWAKKKKIQTISIATSNNSEIGKIAKVKIEIDVGPEVIMGSTRMKSGSAQKMVLNMISTCAMIKLGKVYSNLMVNVVSSNYKLQKRAVNILKEITGCDEKTATFMLKKSKNNIKSAAVMLKKNINITEANKLLKKHNGILRKAIG